MTPTFRLDVEPWIPVHFRDGRSEEDLSLLSLFEHASDVARLAGTPLEVAAIFRLIMALAHLTETPGKLSRWVELWRDRRDFLARMRTCVQEQGDVWDIFSEHHPFMQEARLATGVESTSASYLKLPRAGGGGPSFIDHGYGSEQTQLSPAQAARSLLAYQAFATGGLLTPNPLIPPQQNGQLDKSSSAALLCQSTVAVLEGDSLDESILLNLIVKEEVGTPGWRPIPVSSRGARRADGVADLYTRPIKSVLLKRSDALRITRAVIVSGQAFEANDVERDPMVPHQLHEKSGRYYPLDLRPDRALWRSAHVLLANEGKPLKSIDQLRRLTENQGIDFRRASLRVLGIAGDQKQPKHTIWRDEALAFEHSVIEEHEQFEALLGAIQNAEKTRRTLYSRLYAFAERYLITSGTRPKKEQVDLLIGELAPDYSDYWSALGPRGEGIALDGFDPAAWQRTLKEASESAFRRAVERLPADARRFRAEYAREERTGEAKPKAKAGKK